VTAIVLPNDLQQEAYEDPPRAHGTLRSSIGYAVPKIVPQESARRRSLPLSSEKRSVQWPTTRIRSKSNRAKKRTEGIITTRATKPDDNVDRIQGRHEQHDQNAEKLDFAILRP
jgi:hypothetical protein